MEENRFIFILGGLSGTAAISLGGCGLPFTHWYSKSNNKPCLLTTLQSLKELNIKCLAQCLAYRNHSMAIS